MDIIRRVDDAMSSEVEEAHNVSGLDVHKFFLTEVLILQVRLMVDKTHEPQKTPSMIVCFFSCHG